jgi:hypothetical protein
MPTMLDIRVVAALARTMESFETTLRGSAAGTGFEQALYRALLDAHHWHYAAPPDQFDLGLQIRTRTGVRYEHDGMVADDESLYVLEAKWLSTPVTRQIVGIFVQKLMDTVLGSYAEIGHFALKPAIVAGNAGADGAAFQYAVAFGILLITPGRPTPYALLHRLDRERVLTPAMQDLKRDCQTLATHLWRPLSSLLMLTPNASAFTLAVEHIFDAHRTAQVIAGWDECLRTAEALRLLDPLPVRRR